MRFTRRMLLAGAAASLTPSLKPLLGAEAASAGAPALAEAAAYDGSSIRVLSLLQGIRKRPGMYVGEVKDGSGLLAMASEPAWLALEEGERELRVALRDDGGVDIAGPDADWLFAPCGGRRGGNMLEAVFSAWWPDLDGTFSVAAALSDRCVLTARRDAQIGWAVYEDGEAVLEPVLRALEPDDSHEAPDGWSLRFTPSAAVFGASPPLRAEALAVELRRLAALKPAARIELVEGDAGRVLKGRGALDRRDPGDALLGALIARRDEIAAREELPAQEICPDQALFMCVRRGPVYLAQVIRDPQACGWALNGRGALFADILGARGSAWTTGAWASPEPL
jgi:hypothetical protein